MIEEALQRSIFSQNNDKTFVDKLLAKNEVDKFEEIIKKKKLTREDVLTLLHLISGIETKLVNFDSWTRYVMNKFFIWIREAVKITEMVFDYEDEMEGKVEFTPRMRSMLDTIINFHTHSIKFLVDLYMNLNRTTLSLGGSGFTELLKNKYEINYGTVAPGNSGMFSDRGKA